MAEIPTPPPPPKGSNKGRGRDFKKVATQEDATWTAVFGGVGFVFGCLAIAIYPYYVNPVVGVGIYAAIGCAIGSAIDWIVRRIRIFRRSRARSSGVLMDGQNKTTAERLMDLSDLLGQDLITHEEYNQQRKKIIDEI